uniref:Crotasin n=1 Tax=Crotalus durissus terrificus TaxID=8732 RepID=CTSP2_CRODU|nr:RecName: Full=Crotasin; Flags: Precursor [Crotalus durissus terrificus]AAT47437.1 crotasin [Crotalus durissus terrificus]
MKILYLLSAFLFLAFLSESGNAQPQCRWLDGFCHSSPCPSGTTSIGQQDCLWYESCCIPRYEK